MIGQAVPSVTYLAGWRAACDTLNRFNFDESCSSVGLSNVVWLNAAPCLAITPDFRLESQYIGLGTT